MFRRNHKNYLTMFLTALGAAVGVTAAWFFAWSHGWSVNVEDTATLTRTSVRFYIVLFGLMVAASCTLLLRDT